ncbi:cupin domain-containing protein [Pseudazoarcus pumilus]|uniref:dTDP-4-dehydrorhamnose 3,5-epimerase n=1 Tax=Pseudazoarcus pumilus TaxID=2067960 RepID=A0A2I6S918_9RHOO|nr:dTDP-4-dehydrorhamnose 3,5-epimerase family protein [Pseudazoarcus pumilus]AUN95721.1 dTDP-4-dehydrorhamnose 3,5-epimerase [Pseudazoarcus pumilus]
MNDDNWLLPNATLDAQSITRDWQPADQTLIDGVSVKEVRPVLTGYGHLTEALRGEWLAENAAVDQIFFSTLQPGGLSAWHAHGETTDRLFVVNGQVRVVLYDARKGSPSYGLVNEFKLATVRPMLVVIPPRVWHGVHNYCGAPAILMNAVDRAYRYEGPDHWRVPPDSDAIPYTFPGHRAG